VALLDMKLGDILLAGMANDPEAAGRFLGQAIADIEAKREPGKTDKSPPGQTQRAAE
jgi:hypothetical protein